jgi:TatD DNase family protein
MNNFYWILFLLKRVIGRFDMLVDSHCHLNLLDLTPYDGQLENVLAAAQAQGVSKFLCVCVDLLSFPEVLRIARQFANVYASVGIHPSTEKTHDCALEDLMRHALDQAVIAIGETGLDYHYNSGDLTWQRDRFVYHIEVARITKKPLIIHTRDAKEDTIALMVENKASDAGGVMHCFTETWEMAKQALDLGFYISLSGIVTFKNADSLREVAKKVPLDRLLIETDAPYLAPSPHRGKQNYPEYVRLVAQFLAQLRDIPFETLAHATTENFHRCFEKNL